MKVSWCTFRRPKLLWLKPRHAKTHHPRRGQVQNIPANAALQESSDHLLSSSLREWYSLDNHFCCQKQVTRFRPEFLSLKYIFVWDVCRKKMEGWGGRIFQNFSYYRNISFGELCGVLFFGLSRILGNSAIVTSLGGRKGDSLKWLTDPFSCKTSGRANLSGWWFQPIWKICSSNWIISTGKGENQKCLKPPPSYPATLSLWFLLEGLNPADVLSPGHHLPRVGCHVNEALSWSAK